METTACPHGGVRKGHAYSMTSRPTIHAALTVAGIGLACAIGRAGEGVVRVGSGSYAAAVPAGARLPQRTIYQTANLTATAKMPTNDWWSSLAWMKYSERQYPHPLAVRAEPRGLRVYYPGPNITANRAAIFGFMPAKGDADLVLGHSARAEFPDARVDAFSDWFVTAAFAADEKRMTVSYGHGSPLVFATYKGGAAKLTFARKPAVWSGSAATATLGITVNGRQYALFGPAGSTWSGLGTTTLTNHPGGKRHFSLAVLPDRSPETLALFAQYAHAHVTDTKVTWRYEPKTSTVTTTFTFTTTAREGRPAAGTLFALYPHQWRHTDAKLTGHSYASVRGEMKLARGASFTTRVAFPGVLPSLPDAGGYDKARLRRYVDAAAAKRPPGTKDTYWTGKRIGKLATLIGLAEHAGSAAAGATFTKELKRRLENWLTATDASGKLKSAGVFHYDRLWGTLIGYPAGYGSDVELNDHHFHYGYFIKGAAELARTDPAWSAEKRWGGMIKLLIRDFANADRGDGRFPFLRNFDPYAGHSWASGHAKFGDGNNNESSSEAMNAWCALILWGQATGDRAVRDLGIYLYTTEMTAVNEYWFDVHGTNHHKDYPPSVVTMVWGGKGANGTWFSANPELVHGINFLPIHGGSLYLGHHPAYVKKNYDALAAENKGTQWDDWADIIWMYRALSDPADAARQFDAAEKTARLEAGNSKANAYHWIHTLAALGRVDPTVTADHPLHAVFRKGDTRTYVVYNMSLAARTVTFSDGVKLTAKPKKFSATAQSVARPR